MKTDDLIDMLERGVGRSYISTEEVFAHTGDEGRDRWKDEKVKIELDPYDYSSDNLGMDFSPPSVRPRITRSPFFPPAVGAHPSHDEKPNPQRSFILHKPATGRRAGTVKQEDVKTAKKEEEKPDLDEYKMYLEKHGIKPSMEDVKEAKKESSDYGDASWMAGEGVMEVDIMHAEKGRGADDEPVATPAVLQSREQEKLDEPKKVAAALDLVSVTELPERWRGLFQYCARKDEAGEPVKDKNHQELAFFNRMQSKVFSSVFGTDENIVVAAPTGSGKTTIFELAFIRLQEAHAFGGEYGPLAVYMAPTKALCNERARDWSQRFGSLGLSCVEMTGDTSHNVQGTLRKADLVVTTPEKWDALTRRSDNTSSFLSRLSLMLIDEVHILREDRGATLEVVVSRMKTRGSHIRFIAVSASVPNVDDVARWLGSIPPPPVDTGIYEGGGADGDGQDEPVKPKVEESFREMPQAKVFRFGEDFRPVPLTRHVYGFDGGNEWALSSKLDKELFPIILKHSEGKPVLVFCPTRRSCLMTAEYLCKMYDETSEKGGRVPWLKPSKDDRLVLNDAKLRSLAEYGVAIHHAGLDFNDRRAVEEGFRYEVKGNFDTPQRKLNVIVSTSTLAIGVNLPAHTVVIKGTTTWNGPISGFKEYSDIDVQQMMGRAGRPQYDTKGTVVVMCERLKVSTYTMMLNSRTVLESVLHKHLTEHMNSEIALGTINSSETAQEWLKSSFLYIRIQQNPKHYDLIKGKLDFAKGNVADPKACAKWLEGFVEGALEALKRHKMLCYKEEDDDDESEDSAENEFRSTNFGGIMSDGCISFGTMSSIMQIRRNATFKTIFQTFCGATEFADIRIRPGEQAMLNKLRTCDEIRYPLEDPVATYADKVFIHLQVCFGAIDLEQYEVKTEHSSPHQTLMAIYQCAPRIAKAILKVCVEKGFGPATKAAMQFLHTVIGKAWEDTAVVFRQLPSIGPKSLKVLAERDIFGFEQLMAVDQSTLELWLKRVSPFGMNLLRKAGDMPRYRVAFHEERITIKENEFPRAQVRITILGSGDTSVTPKKSDKKDFKFYNLSSLLMRSDGQYIDFRRIFSKKIDKKSQTFICDVEFTEYGQKLLAYIGVDEAAGCACEAEYEPDIPPEAFPKDKPAVEESDEEDLPDPDEPIATNVGQSLVLPNGNYRCNHQCKDKTACNHVCCKEGVKGKPKKGQSGSKHPAGKHNLRPAAEVFDLINASMDKVSKKARSEKVTSEEPLFLKDDSEDEGMDDADEEDSLDTNIRKPKPKKRPTSTSAAKSAKVDPSSQSNLDRPSKRSKPSNRSTAKATSSKTATQDIMELDDDEFEMTSEKPDPISKLQGSEDMVEEDDMAQFVIKKTEELKPAETSRVAGYFEMLYSKDKTLAKPKQTGIAPPIPTDSPSRRRVTFEDQPASGYDAQGDQDVVMLDTPNQYQLRSGYQSSDQSLSLPSDNQQARYSHRPDDVQLQAQVQYAPPQPRMDQPRYIPARPVHHQTGQYDAPQQYNSNTPTRQPQRQYHASPATFTPQVPARSPADHQANLGTPSTRRYPSEPAELRIPPARYGQERYISQQQASNGYQADHADSDYYQVAQASNGYQAEYVSSDQYQSGQDLLTAGGEGSANEWQYNEPQYEVPHNEPVLGNGITWGGPDPSEINVLAADRDDEDYNDSDFQAFLRAGGITVEE